MTWPDKLRIGQIGMAHSHAADKVPFLRRHPDVDYVGVFEPDDAIWDAFRTKPVYDGVRRLTEDEVLGDPTVEGVFVETMPIENLAWARRALLAGKHILVDKAPSPSLEVLRDVLALAEARGHHVQMGYQFRYAPAFQFVLDWATSGRLGRIFQVRASLPTSQRVYSRWYPHASQVPGGTMYELGCHMIDLVVAILGRPDRVTPVLRADYREFSQPPFPDNTIAVLEYDGALAIVDSSVPHVNAAPLRHFGVHGTRGSVVLEPMEPPRLRLCLDEPRAGYLAGWQEVSIADRPRFAGDVEDFVAVVKGERQPRYSFAHDLLAHETLLRACSAR
ncbi:MAG: Gfo/Idh/MocA family oxidoreductase [Chloroflexi bacterium]|nr:Gfo/Idh/MocA family oxidoreductase [Chloroflexota bacterium]